MPCLCHCSVIKCPVSITAQLLNALSLSLLRFNCMSCLLSLVRFFKLLGKYAQLLTGFILLLPFTICHNACSVLLKGLRTFLPFLHQQFLLLSFLHRRCRPLASRLLLLSFSSFSSSSFHAKKKRRKKKAVRSLYLHAAPAAAPTSFCGMTYFVITAQPANVCFRCN